MIIFNAELSIAISSFKGLEGQKELKKFMKQAHIPREMFRNEGHPTEECLFIPHSKQHSMAARGCKVVSVAEFKELKNNRQDSQILHNLVVEITVNAYNLITNNQNSLKNRQKIRKSRQNEKDSFLTSGFDPNLI